MSTDSLHNKVSVASTNATTNRVKSSQVGNEREQEADHDEDIFKKSLWMWEKFDFDQTNNLIWLVALRLFQAVATTYNLQHPDQYWQGT